MKRTIVAQIFYQILCYLLLLANLIHMSRKYFSYETETSVGFYSPINIISPNLSLCFDLNTLLSGYERMIFYPRSGQYIGLKDKFLFKKVPRVNKILKKCAYRDAEVDQFEKTSNSSQCLSLFNIRRYRMQNLMCYSFHLAKPQIFNFNALSFSVNEPMTLYKLVIGAPLNAGGHTLIPLVHLDELADVDRMFMKELFPSKKHNELYYLNYELFEIYRLPSPHATNCGEAPHIRCFYNCMSRFYKKHALTAATGISLESSATETLKVNDYSISTDRKKKKLLDSIDDFCFNKACKSEACQQQLVITHISGPFKNAADKLSFTVGSFKYPINKIVHSAKLPLVEYLTLCFSLTGIWVGFSVIACITRNKRLDVVSAYKKWQLICTKVTRKLSRYSAQQNVAVAQGKVHTKCAKKVLLVVLKLLVVLIFSVQAINQCVLYSRYQTVLHHEHIINPEFNCVLPSTTVCVDLDELLNEDSPIITEDNFDRLWTGNANLTVRQVLDQTMDEEMLFKCRTRDYKENYYSGTFRLKTREECLKTFKFLKYYSNWHVCYAFKPFSPRKHLQWEFVFQQTNPSRLYSLILNPKVKNLDRLSLVSFYPDEGLLVPYGSSEYPAISQKTGTKRVVMLTFHTEIQERLPKPFDTNCNDFLNEKLCRERCFEAGLSKLHLVPLQNTVLEKSDSKLMRYEQLKNITLHKHWVNLERNCHSSCLLNLCHTNFTRTYARHFPDRTQFDVELLVSTEAGPRIRSMSLPRFPFYDFYYQMFCLLTFWLDFSFVGLNFVKRRREKLISKNVKLLYAKSFMLLLKLVYVTRLRASIDPTRKSFARGRSVVKLICVIGMCIHLVIPFVEYFNYNTILLTTISLERPNSYRFTLCSEAQELYEKRIIFAAEKADKHHRDIFDKSLDDIMSETHKSIKSDFLCGYWGVRRNKNELNDMTRLTDRIFFETDNSSLCREMLSTRSSLNHGHICFKFGLHRANSWTWAQMFNTFNKVKTIFTVSIDSSIISSRFTVLADQRKRFEPYHSALWAASVVKEPEDTRYVISYILYVVKPLPYPYSDTGFTPGHYSHCFYKCTNSRLEQFNLTRTHMGELPPKNKLISNSLRGNRSLNCLVNHVDQMCNRKCASTNFGSDLEGNTLQFTISLVSEAQPYFGPKNGFTRFDLRRTDDPAIKMKFLVAISIYDLIINVGSIISIWFGLSVIQIPDLASKKSTEQIHSETLDNLKRAKLILDHLPN